MLISNDSMKEITIFIVILVMSLNLSGQTIKISDELDLIQLTDKTYIHTCNNNNGIVFINKKKAVIVSTPDSDKETQNLIDWVTKKQKATIVGYIIDRWHPDAMEGLDVVLQNNIKTYSYELTREIAKEKGLPVPETGFNLKTEIKVGNEKIICHFLGEAHTSDGIVVWIPCEKILFGGNEIRNFNGWVGNISDARLDKWSETATRIKKEYSTAKIVIPGHGKHGGTELIDYTIELYEKCKKVSSINNFDSVPESKFKTNEDFIFTSESDSIQDGKLILKNAVVFARDSTKYIKIESPLITYQPDKKRIDSESGVLNIYDKTTNGTILRTNISYKKLIVFKKNDSVGLRVIVKEFMK